MYQSDVSYSQFPIKNKAYLNTFQYFAIPKCLNSDLRSIPGLREQLQNDLELKN